MPPEIEASRPANPFFWSALLSLERKFVQLLATGLVALSELRWKQITRNFAQVQDQISFQLIMNPGSRFKVTMPEPHRRRCSLRAA
jgi:hypothetical protein